jgi:hypothetical protein
LLEFSRKDEEDANQHIFLYEAISNSKGTTLVANVVEFHKTLQSMDLEWYMKFIHCPQGGVVPTPDEVKR